MALVPATCQNVRDRPFSKIGGDTVPLVRLPREAQPSSGQGEAAQARDGPRCFPRSPTNPTRRVINSPRGLLVPFQGHDGREAVFDFSRLPLPARHEDLAQVRAVRCGPAGTLRTKSSANSTFAAIRRLLTFLTQIPEPPVTPGVLNAAPGPPSSRGRSDPGPGTRPASASITETDDTAIHRAPPDKVLLTSGAISGATARPPSRSPAAAAASGGLTFWANTSAACIRSTSRHRRASSLNPPRPHT